MDMAALSIHVWRSWAWPVAGLALAVSGCSSRPDERTALAQRTQQAVEDLQRLQPRLAKSGTPEAEVLADHLAAVRTSLSSLPTKPQQQLEPAAEPDPTPPPPIASVRCPDEGCWRLSLAVEVQAWNLHIHGPSTRLDDTGPPAVALAFGLERSQPIDHRLEWSLGGEAVVTRQDRTDGQYIGLIGLRPVIRAALAVSDSWAVAVRPIVEIGQVDLRLGSAPGTVLDHDGLYAGIGVRAGIRGRLADGDLIAEIGWRSLWFNPTNENDTYQTKIDSPEGSLGWAARF